MKRHMNLKIPSSAFAHVKSVWLLVETKKI